MANGSELKLYQRLEAFRRKHKITDETMSAALGTSIHAYRAWKYRQVTPPGSAEKLLNLFEAHPSVRILAGAVREKRKPRHSFAKGNPWRLTSERARALRERQLNGSNL
jgi:hypothetical protein